LRSGGLLTAQSYVEMIRKIWRVFVFRFDAYLVRVLHAAAS